MGFVPRIPYGTKDFLPKEALSKRLMEASLAEFFGRWGYEEVVTPTFEFLDIFTAGTGTDSINDMFKFFEKNNRTVALRPDMTTPIARVAASRLKDNRPPLRLFYLTNIFRYEEAQAGRQCEFYQAGAELIGVPGPHADAEIVALAVEALKQAGLERFQINIGQVDFINGIMENTLLSAKERSSIKHCLLKRDLVGLDALLEQSHLDPDAQKLLQLIPQLHGKEEVLQKAYTLTSNATSRAALDNLSDLFKLLVDYGLDEYVQFDLGIIRDLEYYTGMVFEGYTAGLGFPVLGGGRYDKLISCFGMDSPATGFALGIERVLLAKERQGLAKQEVAKDVYIAWALGCEAKAIQKAQELRREGKVVSLALIQQDKKEAEQAAKDNGFVSCIYIRE